MASDTSYSIGPDTCSYRMSRAKQLRRHLPFLLDILTVCPQCSMSSYPNFPNIFPQDSHVDLKQCPTKTFYIQYIIQEFSSLSLVQQFLFNYSPYTVPKEIDFPRYNMQRGKRDTTRKNSCSIMFSFFNYISCYHENLDYFSNSVHISFLSTNHQSWALATI